MPSSDQKPGEQPVFALCLVVFCVARILQLYAGRLPGLLIVVAHVVPPGVFAIMHGWRIYSRRGMAAFTGFCLGAGVFFESLSLRTGFPFGHYFFTDVMGFKLFQLPVLLAIAYLGMGYVSWIIAVVLDGRLNVPFRGIRLVTVPLIASCAMVAWDLAMDPVWANIDHAWVWRDGGAWFGVPVSNYLGWFLTVYTFYQAFAIYLGRKRAVPEAVPRSLWRLAVLFYGASAAGNLLLAIPSSRGAPGAFVQDASGHRWGVASIIEACLAVSIFVMGGFALAAWARLTNDRPMKGLT